MASVLDQIVADVSTYITSAAIASGYTNASILRDEYAVLNFPPDPTAEWLKTNALNVVIQMPRGEMATPSNPTTNYDMFSQHFKVCALCYVGAPADADAMAAQQLSAQVENNLLLTVQQLRGDPGSLNHLQRGGWADNTLNFSFDRWAYGDGSGAGYTLEFDVIYRTAQNDPNTKG